MSTRHWRVLWAVAIAVLTISWATDAVGADEGSFNHRGNLLISDQFNNRAVEINPETRKVVWSFGSNDPSLCNPGTGAIIGLNDAERLGQGLTLLAGTGIPAGASPSTPNGCVDNRVIVVSRSGQIVWQYGQAGVTGSDDNQLNTPVFAIQLPNRNIIVVDQGNNRVIEIARFTKKVVWSYGALNNPNSAELLTNGHLLIADENNNRAIEITRSGDIVWEYSAGIQFAAFASRLPNGHTLIVDSGHARIVEVTRDKRVVFEYFTDRARDSNPSPLPTNAVQLAGGDISIADQFNNRVLIIDREKELEFQYGQINVAGSGPNQLNGPYTSFEVGDYTGQTRPPSVF